MQEIKAILFYSPFLILFQAGLWKLFKKAGEKGWKSVVPVYNIIVWLGIIKKPKWWVLLLFIPIVNLYVYSIMVAELLIFFNRTKFYQHFLGVVFGPFYIPYLGYNTKVQYSVSFNSNRSLFRELIDPVCWIIILLILTKWFVFETFVIPTPSMEKTLLVGDVIVVSKIHYGPRTPVTPLQVPLTHQTISWMNNIKSYCDWIKLSSWRLPGLSNVNRNDVVVFNWPVDNLHPIDLKTYYIKRCIGIPGDTLNIRNSKIFINGNVMRELSTIQYFYKVFTNKPISKVNFKRYNILSYNQYEKRLNYIDGSKLGYYIEMTPAIADQLTKDDVVDSVQAEIKGGSDNYGPLWIPKRGTTIFLNNENIGRYGRTILDYEGLRNTEIKNEKLYIEGREIKSYTFRNDYYFMIGDNRHNSIDSRFWGLVPENYILGKACLVLFSIDKDPYKSIPESIRWSKLFSIDNL